MSNNVLRNSSDVFLLDEDIITKLKNIAKEHPLKRARICLHESLDNKVHEMVIVARKDAILNPHKHPSKKPESYHVIEGKLKVLIFNDDGSIKDKFFLSSNSHPKMYRIKGDIWHQPIPVSEWVVYHEVATGPFLKSDDVIYLEDKQ